MKSLGPFDHPSACAPDSVAAKGGFASVLVASALVAICSCALAGPASGAIKGNVVDDPNGILGKATPKVKKVASRTGFRVSIIPGLGDRTYAEAITGRLSTLAPGGAPGDLLLLLVRNQKVAIFGVRNRSKLRKRQGKRAANMLLFQRRQASLSATRAFGMRGASAAVFAGARELRSERQDPGINIQRIDIEWGWGWLRLLVPLLLAFALFNLIRAFRARRRLEEFAGGALAIRDLTPGTAMISGTADSADPLASPFTDSPCVYYEYSVSEDWIRSETDGTIKLDSGENRTAFELHDATGSVTVVPDRADIDSPPPLKTTVDRNSPDYDVPGLGGLPFPFSDDSAGIRHFEESVIPVGAQVTVLGPVTVGDSGPVIEWKHSLGPGPSRPFLISHHEPGWAEHYEKKRMKRFFSVAAVTLGATVFIAVITI